MSAASGAGPQTSAPAPRLFQPPLSARLLSLFGTVILAFVTAMMAVFAVLALGMQWALGVFVMALAVFIGALTGYVWRDLSGKWSYSIRLEPTAVQLNLPAGRSLIHRPPKQHLTVPYADIKSVETRLEAYGSLGMETMQRAYVLRRRNDDLIFLFEDRALGTGLETQLFAYFASDLAARAGVAVRTSEWSKEKAAFSACGEPMPPTGRRPHCPWRGNCASGGMRGSRAR